MQLFQYEQRALWTFLISHANNEVLHHIQLDVVYSDIDRNKDTYDSRNIPSTKILMWSLLPLSGNIKTTIRDTRIA